MKILRVMTGYLIRNESGNANFFIIFKIKSRAWADNCGEMNKKEREGKRHQIEQ